MSVPGLLTDIARLDLSLWSAHSGKLFMARAEAGRHCTVQSVTP